MRVLSSFPGADQLRAWLGDTARPVRIAARFLRSLAVLVIAAHAVLFVVVLLASLVLLHWNPPVTALMIWRGATVHQKPRPVRFVPLRQIPRVARTMVIRLEDYRFYSHHGVDLGAIRDAWMINSSIGRTAVGGSTIPMQLARNLFLTPRKTYLRKYMEALIAVEMDLVLPKDRILELYLNYIEWGKGVFGIGAASAYYFKTGVGGLGLDELRRLATIITNPLRYDVESFSRSPQMTQRYAYLLSRFPDPTAEPADGGWRVAPVPDAPAQAPGAPPMPAAVPSVQPVSPPPATVVP
jgi:monofunctional biosynthetic peptidoglycan transglycosylase